MFHTDCLHPQLLINRSAITHFLNGHHIIVDSRPQSCSNSSELNRLLRRARLLSPQQLDNSYILLFSSYRLPLFFYAPCRSCVNCQSKRQKELIALACIEESKYTIPPYFVTLTYDDAHLPKTYSTSTQSNLCYRDIQLFFKRFRKILVKRGLSTDFKYLVSGEYGTHFHRPHYHLIIFNNPYGAHELNPIAHDQFRRDVFLSWGKCQLQGFDFGQCRGNAVAYAVKYCGKISTMPKGASVKPFIRHSINFGYKPELFSYFDTQYSNLLPYSSNGLFKYSYMGKYLVSKYYPSPSKLVPSKVYNLWLEFVKTSIDIVRCDSLMYDTIFYNLETLRPYKSIINLSSFPTKRKFPFVTHCKTFINIFLPRFLSVYADLYNELLVYSDCDIDIQDFTKYLEFIKSIPDIPQVDNTATITFKNLDKQAVTKSLTKL